MTVKELINYTAKLLEEEDVCMLLSDKAPKNSEYASSTLELLKRCLDVITDEIACEFYPVKAIQTFNVTDQKIYYKDFSSVPIKILEVRGENNEKCPYRLISDHFTVSNGKKTVLYLNGEAVATGDNAVVPMPPRRRTPIAIGSTSAGGAGYGFDGMISKFQLYDRALTADEIADME